MLGGLNGGICYALQQQVGVEIAAGCWAVKCSGSAARSLQWHFAAHPAACGHQSLQHSDSRQTKLSPLTVLAASQQQQKAHTRHSNSRCCCQRPFMFSDTRLRLQIRHTTT